MLISQALHKPQALGQGLAATQAVIEHLGYIQIDSISVVERAHHHSLWSRTCDYQASSLQDLMQQKNIFEYWAHTAALLSMQDFRFSLPKKHAIAAGQPRRSVASPRL